MIFLKKYTEIWYFLKTFWKYGIFWKGRAGTWSFLYYLERWYFFPPKHDIFTLGRKWGMTFVKKYMEIWICCVHVRVLRPSAKKNEDSLIPQKCA